MDSWIQLIPMIMAAVIIYPVMRGLARMANTIADRNAVRGQDEQVARLEAELQQVKEDLQRVMDRQQFVEALLEKRADPPALPR